eukprot:7998753-Pyramimonas_sp.AAC.1
MGPPRKERIDPRRTAAILLNLPPYLLRRMKDTVESRQQRILVHILSTDHRVVPQELGRIILLLADVELDA